MARVTNGRDLNDKKVLELALKKKQRRKAESGGRAKLINIPRNWLHQALSYMDKGELSVRLVFESIELYLVWFLLKKWFGDTGSLSLLGIAFVFVHTWNWVTNCLFWSVIIFTFPKLRNPGAHKTIKYLNTMRQRLADKKCIAGIAIYGSVTRGEWHDRSDIDIRLIRQPGIVSLWCAAILTMQERFRALLNRQPMDLFLADGIDFLEKMRSDEIPLLLLCKNDDLQTKYPRCGERDIFLEDLVKGEINITDIS